MEPLLLKAVAAGARFSGVERRDTIHKDY